MQPHLITHCLKILDYVLNQNNSPYVCAVLHVRPPSYSKSTSNLFYLFEWYFSQVGERKTKITSVLSKWEINEIISMIIADGIHPMDRI